MADLADPKDARLTFHDGSCYRCGATGDLLRFTEFGKAVCAACYPAFFRRRVARTLSRYQMVRKKDTIGVAVSGGKDSGALLHALWTMRHDLGLWVAAVHVHMGLGAYSDRSLASAEELAGRLGVRLVVERISDLGIELAPTGSFAMCSVCGAVRRALLDRVGLREGWSAIATGHTLDDRLQQMLKRLLTGRLDAPRPVLPGDAAHPPRVKPLCLIPDRAVVAYAQLEGLSVCPDTCPEFDPQTHRFRAVFELLESLAPMAKVQLVQSLGRAMNRPSPGGPELPCPDCGNPTASGLCPICRLRRLAAEQEPSTEREKRAL